MIELTPKRPIPAQAKRPIGNTKLDVLQYNTNTEFWLCRITIRKKKMAANNTNVNKSGKASEETIAKLTQNMVTSLTSKTIADKSIRRILVLVSTTSGSRRQLSCQERSISMLEALEIPFETLNCALPEHRQRRDELFDISGVRGDFPQFFLFKGGDDDDGGAPEFLGQFDDMETCNEKSNLPADALKETDVTWDKIMGTKNKYNNKGVSLDGVDDDSEGSGGADGGIYGGLDDDDDEEGGGNIYAGL